MGKRTAADELEQQRSEKAFADADARLNAISQRRQLMQRLTEKNEESKQRAADIQARKEAKERKADPLYDERKAARAKAEQGAVTKMVDGVKVTEYPSVDPVEKRPTAQIKNAIKNVTGKDVDEVLENVKAPTKDARAESIKNSMTRGGGGGGGIRGGGSGTLGGGAGATGADLLHQMNPQKLMKKGGAVRSASQRADGCAIRGKTRA